MMAPDPKNQHIGLMRIWSEAGEGQTVTVGALTKHVLTTALDNVRQAPLTSSLSVLTISVALVLLGIFVLLFENAEQSVSISQGQVLLHVYLNDSASESDTKKLAGALRAEPGVLNVTYRSKAEALESFRKTLGTNEALLGGLEKDNPLPASLDVTLDVSLDDLDRRALANRISRDSRVEHVQYSHSVVEQLKRLLEFVRTGGTFLVLFLLVVTGFIITNTIKLALYAHRLEVEIMQLVGASRPAIYAPYVIEGFMQGALGALVALGLLGIVYLLVQDVLVSTDLLRFVFPNFVFLSLRGSVLVVMCGMAVGVAGSFLAVKRFLRDV